MGARLYLVTLPPLKSPTSDLPSFPSLLQKRQEWKAGYSRKVCGLVLVWLHLGRWGGGGGRDWGLSGNWGMAGARGALQSPVLPPPPPVCSPRKLVLAALFTSAEWHLVSRVGDSLFPKERKKVWG